MKTRLLSTLCVLIAVTGSARAVTAEGRVARRVGELEQTVQRLQLAKAQAAQAAQAAAQSGTNVLKRVEELEATVRALLDELAALKQQVAEAEKKAAAPSATALNPGISVIADFTGRRYRGDRTAPGLDFSQKNRFALREAEVGFQSALDPFGRLDAFVAVGA